MQNEKISEKKNTIIKNNIVLKKKEDIELLNTDGKKKIESKHNSKHSDW
jgi:hypothetical protein